MKTQLLTFENTDNQSLQARLATPDKAKPHSYAIFAHCFTCGKDLSAIRYISQALTDQGFAVLSFDFTGLGQSDGDFSDTSFTSNISDLAAAATYLSTHFEAPKLLVGHSLGGAAVLAAAAEIPSVKAVAAIGAPADPAHVTALFGSAIEQIQTEGKADVLLANRPFTIGKPLLDSLMEGTQADKIHSLRAAKLILHSPQDETVSINSAAAIFDLSVHPKSFVTLDGANHLLTNKQDAMYAGDVIASWAMRYIEATKDASAKTQKASDTTPVTARLRLRDKYTTSIKTRQHSIVADEPESLGGNDLGMTPYELVSAGLSACTVITLQMYAARKSLPLEEVIVSIEHAKIKNADMPSGFEDSFTRHLTLKGNLDDVQKQKLLDIADKCPVHKTLHQASKIETLLVE